MSKCQATAAARAAASLAEAGYPLGTRRDLPRRARGAVKAAHREGRRERTNAAHPGTAEGADK